MSRVEWVSNLRTGSPVWEIYYNQRTNKRDARYIHIPAFYGDRGCLGQSIPWQSRLDPDTGTLTHTYHPSLDNSKGALCLDLLYPGLAEALKALTEDRGILEILISSRERHK